MTEQQYADIGRQAVKLGGMIATGLLSLDPDTSPPTITTAVIPAAGNSLVITFNEPVTGHDTFGMNAAGSPVTLTYASGEGSSRYTFTVDPVVTAGQLCVGTRSIGNDVTDASGNHLAAGTFPVTNNSTQ